MKNLLNISLLFLLTCCTSEEKNNILTAKQDEKSINNIENLGTLKKIDSNHLEKRNTFLKDSEAQVEFEKMQLT